MKFNLKKVIASVAALAMSLSCFTAFAADFSDVEATASYKNSIDTLVALEVVNGYEDGTFKPDAEITRAEVTKMVVAAMGPSYTAAAESSVGASEFSDVTGHWAAGYISVGVAQKFINGMGDGTFAPDANVTYAQIVKMLVAALGYESAANIAGGYPNGYLSTGNQIGVTAGVSGVSADTNVTRAQVAQLIANAIDVPLVVVENWTTNILTGEPVAETEIKDGTGENYKTLLTEYHNAYAVKGRVTATAAQGGRDAGTAEFTIEYADNYEDLYVDVKKDDYHYEEDGKGYEVEVYTGDTGAEDLLFTYAEAIIAIDEDDEAHLISIFPYGKNEIIEFAAKDYIEATTDDADALETVKFETASSARGKVYTVDAAAKLYVNGILVNTDAALTKTAFESFLSQIGTVTLIDAPAAGQTSKDGKFDYIMVTKKVWAIVDTTMVDDENLEIYLTKFENEEFEETPIVIDTENEEFVYSFYKDGEEVEFDAIKTDDVLLLTYDQTGAEPSANASNFITIEISDKVVEGPVTAIKKVDGVDAYTIAGADYKLAAGVEVPEAGSTYTAKLDAVGRIVDIEETATSANFGIIDRVKTNGNTDENEIRIIKADGTRQTYIAKTTEIFTEAKEIAYAVDDKDNDDPSDDELTEDLNPIVDRAVKFKANSKGEITDFINEFTALTEEAEFTASSKRVGKARMGAATQIIDLVDVEDVDDNATYTAADIKVGSIDTFVDGEVYTVLYGDKVPSDSTYRFVVVLEGNPTINATTSFAVVKGVETALNEEGTTVPVITAYTVDGAAEVELSVDEDAKLWGYEPGTPAIEDDPETEDVNEYVAAVDDEKPAIALDSLNTTLKEGDVIVYHLNAEGAVSELYRIYSQDDDILSPFGANDPDGDPTKFFRKNGIEEWTSSDDDSDWARIGFGVILAKGSSTITFAPDKDVVTDDETEEFDLAPDVAVFVYDNDKRVDNKVSKGAIGSVVPTSIPKNNIEELGDGSNQYTLTDLRIKTAFFKVLNGEISEIYIVK